MPGDNAIFDANGDTKEQLSDILTLATKLMRKKIEAYKVDAMKGIVLYWHVEDRPKDLNIQTFPLPTWGLIVETIWAFLHETDWKVTFDEWEGNIDQDGTNSLGFRVKTGTWGRIDDESTYSFLLIKPVYIWYGK